jgi:hypothetical protein
LQLKMRPNNHNASHTYQLFLSTALRALSTFTLPRAHARRER